MESVFWGWILVRELVLEGIVDTKETEMESVFDSEESEWMEERERDFGVGEGQEELEKVMPFVPPRAMVRGYVGEEVESKTKKRKKGKNGGEKA